MYPPFPPGFQLGPLAIRWYGLIMVTAIFVGALLASRYVARRGQDSNTIWNLLLWVVIPAIIGARLYYVFIQSPRGPNGLDNYLAHPLAILEIWQGGIHIYGALIGGGLALLIYAAVKKLPVLIYLDAIALVLPFSQAIGRLGNFMNQELYGPPTTLPWGLRIDPAYRIAPYNNLALYPESVRFQPLFLYEMLWNLLGFALIFWLSRRLEKKLRGGDILLMYLIWYPLGRFFLEFFRTDSWFFAGTPFDLVHLLSAFVILASIVLLFARHQGRARQPAITLQGAASAAGLFEAEDSVEAGISMSMEYTFLQKGSRASEPELLENEEELVESEGVEDIEAVKEWDESDPLAEIALVEEEEAEEDEEEEPEEIEEEEAEEETGEEESSEEGTSEEEEESEEEVTDEGDEEGAGEDEEASEDGEGEEESAEDEGDTGDDAEGSDSGDDTAGSDDGDAGDE